jgi:GNAT superfamily N-acetyltransferase
MPVTCGIDADGGGGGLARLTEPEPLPLRYTAEYSATHPLADGIRVRLRLLRPDDRDWLLAGFARLSAESRYRRFFTAMPELPEPVVRRLLAVDGWNHLAIAAEAATEDPGGAESFGVARFIRLPAAPHIAEAAVAVVDHMQRRGLGTLLLATLAAAARERRITRFRAEVLRTNGAANALLREFAEHAQAVMEGPVAVYEAALPDAAADETMPGALFRFLALAGRGLQVLWTTR